MSSPPIFLRLTIAIPTFQRPERLRRLLDALPSRIAETPGVEIEVLVIDNDPAGSGARAVHDIGIAVRYVREPKPGIAAVRNRALDACEGSDLLAFIDDDEVPRPHWLSALFETWTVHRSSAVMGRVISIFDGDVDPWVEASGTFYRPLRPTGSPLETAAAGNLLLDLAQVRALGVRFDESLGLGGGEDTLFSRQLVGRGGTIVYCAESETEDEVIAERLTRDWARQRAYSSANAWSLARLRLTSGTAARLLLRARLTAGGILRMSTGSVRRLVGIGLGRLEHDARGARTHHRGRGMVAAALGHHYQEYARPPKEMP